MSAVFWTGVCLWGMELAGWLPETPFPGIMTFYTAIFGPSIVPFQRRKRRLRLPGATSIPIAGLVTAPAGTLVHARGRVRALRPMATYLGDIHDAVFRHLELVGTTPRFGAHRDFRVHDVEARDFLLVDETGAVEIRMHDAETMLPERMLHLHDAGAAWELIEQLVHPDARPRDLYRPTIIERWLADGDEIEVLGTVERQADPRYEALPRELPTRPVLVSTRDQPLRVQLLRGR